MQRCIILPCIMNFMNRIRELERLRQLAEHHDSGLAVIYGRRRVGKTRLLLEWCGERNGAYWVADQSTEPLQRRYFASAMAKTFVGFDQVEYSDWWSLLERLAREATQASWRGPLVIDELPYLVIASPSFPSLLQRWIDHDAKKAKLTVAIAGSSQRMMQGLVLDQSAPLYGRAQAVLEIQPIEPQYLSEAFPDLDPIRRVETYSAWGGVPRYWELARPTHDSGNKSVREMIDELVLDPLGPLHQEPDRLLLEETPSAIELRPILDVIGRGAHRVSEIASRIGRAATAMSRPLDRLRGLSMIVREIPFGESEKTSRRSLYRITDPFLRLWFRVVASQRSALSALPASSRLAILDQHWNGLVSQTWEQLCRTRLPHLAEEALGIGELAWGKARRWWRGNEPEWDVVAESISDKQLLLGEVKWRDRPLSPDEVRGECKKLSERPRPNLPKMYAKHAERRVLFIPETTEPMAIEHEVHIVTASHIC